MTHHHVLSVRGLKDCLANVPYEVYEDALDVYNRLTVQMFAHRLGTEKLNLSEAAKYTDYGAPGSGALTGNKHIAFLLVTCESECEWLSATWN